MTFPEGILKRTHPKREFQELTGSSTQRSSSFRAADFVQAALCAVAWSSIRFDLMPFSRSAALLLQKFVLQPQSESEFRCSFVPRALQLGASILP